MLFRADLFRHTLFRARLFVRFFHYPGWGFISGLKSFPGPTHFTINRLPGFHLGGVLELDFWGVLELDFWRVDFWGVLELRLRTERDADLFNLLLHVCCYFVIKC